MIVYAYFFLHFKNSSVKVDMVSRLTQDLANQPYAQPCSEKWDEGSGFVTDTCVSQSMLCTSGFG